MTLMDTILRRKPVEIAEPVIAKARHDEVVRGLNIQIETHIALGRGREGNIKRLIIERDGLRDDVRAAEQAYEGVLRDKIATDGRASAWKDSAFRAAAALEEYKADALKYRERCRRDREAAAAKRKSKGGLV